MKIHPLLLGVCLGISPVLYGQSKKSHRAMIKEIRKECENYNSDIERFQNSEKTGYGSIRVNEVLIDKYTSSDHPGLGECNSSTTFYYYKEGIVSESNEVLFKIERLSSVAAHGEYHEYYFNVDGQLIFYYELIDGENASRFYFKNEKLIEHRETSSMSDARYKGDSLSQSHLSNAREVLEKTKRLKTAIASFHY